MLKDIRETTQTSKEPKDGSSCFREGETALLVDRKNRRYLFDLTIGEEFQTHSGLIRHADIVGVREGTLLRNSKGAIFLALRPTFRDVILKMPRGAQIIYPKDLGALLIQADIFSGVRVLEAGVGSGALSMALLRVGAVVTGYERRKDFCVLARRNVERFCGQEAMERYHTEVRDVYEGISETELDRVILDLPEPWRVVPTAAATLRYGGIFCSYTPSIVQVSRLYEALADSPFGLPETTEVLQRSWYVAGPAVRPEHRMVAHTGFLTTARLLVE